MTQNEGAFLALIAHTEGTDRAPDPYRVCYGYSHTIADLSDHPTLTGEWRGEPLDLLGPRYAGLKSTAAGRYQLTVETWREAKAALELPDFTAASQDTAALWLIERRHALDFVNAGNVVQAIIYCSGEWASLPGGTSGQPEKSMVACLARYRAGGGALA